MFFYRFIIVICFAVFVVPAPAVNGAKLSQIWVVTAITDADSIRSDSKRLRLYGIDAPELDQFCEDRFHAQYACGRQAADFLRSIVRPGDNLYCEHIDTDRYKRLVVRCFHDGQDISDMLVRSGWALAYREYATDYIEAEQFAKQAGSGIWQGAFIWPSDWRRQKRQARK